MSDGKLTSIILLILPKLNLVLLGEKTVTVVNVAELGQHKTIIIRCIDEQTKKWSAQCVIAG